MRSFTYTLSDIRPTVKLLKPLFKLALDYQTGSVDELVAKKKFINLISKNDRTFEALMECLNSLDDMIVGPTDGADIPEQFSYILEMLHSMGAFDKMKLIK